MKNLLTSLYTELSKLTAIPFENDILKLKKAFSDFDTLSLNDKKNRVEKAFLILDRISSSIPFHNLNHDYTSTDFKQAFDHSSQKLSLPVQNIRGIGPKIAQLFKKKNIETVEDLLYFVPRKYEDRRFVKNISSAIPGHRETVIGTVTGFETRHYGTKKVFEVTISDGENTLQAKWFKGNFKYLQKTFKVGHRVIMTGDIRAFLLQKEMIHPDFELIDETNEKEFFHFKRIIPIYSELEGIHQKYLRKILFHAVDEYARYLLSPIPSFICKKRKLLPIDKAIRTVHFPESNEDVSKLNKMRSDAHRRIVYDEFFFFQLGIAMKRKASLLDEGISFKTDVELLEKFYSLLPFQLTDAQKRVVQEIKVDMRKKSSMNRLLQGDVGSGKTVIAMIAMIIACANGRQAAIMAPTEILAEQHCARIKGWSEELGLDVDVLTSAVTGGKRKKIVKKLENGSPGIIVGTHALIQEDIVFSNLGLVIIDEQHRFGVIQRATLRKKGVNPDVLVMTATPIPRTLAMTVYGDLDISIIDESPPGRKEIETRILYEDERDSLYRIIEREIKKGNQVFIVYPLVEESENLDLKNATDMARHLKEYIFPQYRVGLIHGRMKSQHKDQVMGDFSRKKIDILVSTTVIEVGIDIPDASLIVIEHAERFGLSQLHQLRGRVGRSNIPAYCILVASSHCSEEAKRRLHVMERTNDGFKIAEEDLALRGPGEFLGTKQSGVPDFHIAHILRDARILHEARVDAFSIIEGDPLLEKEEHQALRKVLFRRWGQRLDLAKTG